MDDRRVRRVVIVGGGTAGWMAAAAINKIFGERVAVTLIESDDIGIVGVGEATIPPIRAYNAMVGLDEDAFLRATQGTIKLGIQFVGWHRAGEAYMHAFGSVGKDLGLGQFWQYWLRARQLGQAGPIDDYSITGVAALAGKFLRGEPPPGSHLPALTHAFHFDAGLYARYLRDLCEQRGVKRIEGKIVDTQLRAADGFIEAVRLESGATVGGDLFVDCSGFRSLLLGQALGVPYIDWSHWLPANRAWAVPCELPHPAEPYTRSTAHGAGWQWRIPLQHRIGNGFVFSNEFIGEDEAAAGLVARLDGRALADPRLIRFTTGHRRQFWHRNCVALGLASGFLEPLESTSIHLVHSNIARLINFFPDLDFAQANIDEYNAQTLFEFERIRDFIVLHYHANEREGALWDYMRHLDLPAELKQKMAVFRANGRIMRVNNELFAEDSWLQVFLGQGVVPLGHNPLADALTDAEAVEFVDTVGKLTRQRVKELPTHTDWIARFAKAAPRH